eukprot:3217319-Alexandrium_andersonii.AAC.1
MQGVVQDPEPSRSLNYKMVAHSVLIGRCRPGGLRLPHSGLRKTMQQVELAGARRCHLAWAGNSRPWHGPPRRVAAPRPPRRHGKTN